jgi:hypothetical protein
MNDYLTRAIRILKPTAEFSIVNSDYSTVKWDVLEGDAPTLAEIEIAVEQVKANELAEAEAKAAAKELAQSKLATLGLTVEDLSALGL